MWLGRDVGVEPDLTVRNIGPATTERSFRVNQRISQLKRDSIGGNM